jgi:hypothetical protein
MLKKLKKGLKKAAKGVAKIGVPVGAAILAAKAMKKDKGALTADMTRDMVPMDNRMIPGATSAETKGIREIAKRGTIDEKDYDIYGNKKSYKSGGRVGVGIAKRGFGRAMKGKK